MQKRYKAVSISLLILLMTACSSKAERGFMAGCTQSYSKSECSCVYANLEKHYSPEVMEQMGSSPDSFPEDFMDRAGQAAFECSQ